MFRDEQQAIAVVQMSDAGDLNQGTDSGIGNLKHVKYILEVDLD